MFNTGSRSLVLSVTIRLAIAREMTSRDGEDVSGCRMAAIDCVIVSALLEADGLTRSDYYKHSMAGNKIK